MVIGTTPVFQVVVENMPLKYASSVIFYFTQGKDDVRICKRFDTPLVEDEGQDDVDEDQKTYHLIGDDDYWCYKFRDFTTDDGTKFIIDYYANSIGVMLTQAETLRFKPNSVMNWGIVAIYDMGNQVAFDDKTGQPEEISMSIIRYESPIFTEDVKVGLYGGIISEPTNAPKLPYVSAIAPAYPGEEM